MSGSSRRAAAANVPKPADRRQQGSQDPLIDSISCRTASCPPSCGFRGRARLRVPLALTVCHSADVHSTFRPCDNAFFSYAIRYNRRMQKTLAAPVAHDPARVILQRQAAAISASSAECAFSVISLSHGSALEHIAPRFQLGLPYSINVVPSRSSWDAVKLPMEGNRISQVQGSEPASPRPVGSVHLVVSDRWSCRHYMASNIQYRTSSPTTKPARNKSVSGCSSTGSML